MAYDDFTFGSTHCSAFDTVFVVDSWPASPPANVNKTAVGGRHGTARYKGRFYQEHSLSGMLYFLDVTDVQLSNHGMMERGVSVSNWLCGAEGRQRLILDATPDRFYMAEVEDALAIETADWPCGHVPITFVLQPFAFALAENTATATLAANVETSLTLTVSGNRSAPLGIEVTAAAAVSWIQAKIGSRLLRLEGMSLTAGQKAIVSYDVANNEIMAVNVAGSPGMRYLTAESEAPFYVESGANIVKLTASGACEAVISARGRWLQ